MKTYYMRAPNGEVFTTSNPEYHKDCEQFTQAAGKKAYKESRRNQLAKLLEGVDTVYGTVRHVSSSGMSRDIDLYIIRDNEPVCITGYASTVLDYPMSKNSGMKVGGCGMDMVFHCVYSIACAIGRDYKTLNSRIL